MRILAMADIHGNYQVYERIPALSVESKVDTVAIAGDLLGVPDGFRTVEEAECSDANHIVEILDPLKVPLLYIMGNDDLVEL